MSSAIDVLTAGWGREIVSSNTAARPGAGTSSACMGPCAPQAWRISHPPFSKSQFGSLLFVLLLAIVISAPAVAQISPGPLSRAHQDLSGPSGCTSCHAMSAGSPNFRCLDCHQEILARLRDHRGLHPNIMDASLRHNGCERCHSEHNGAAFALVKWNPSPNGFDHAKTGYRLEGKHAELACARCHNAQKISPSERGTIRMKDLGRSFLGLPTACTGCHEDKHRGELGSRCERCHNTTEWKAGRTFDHARTRFPLRGAHLQVRCEQCHASSAGTPRFNGIRFDRCADCHRDPHGGAFRDQTCESCHTTAGWKPTTFLARFDHASTKFALQGRHADVKCQTCHRAADFARPIAHEVCADCHKDVHGGQFAKRPDGGRCESCHSVAGFKQAKFTASEHAGSMFPLRGKHAQIACARCHTPAGQATVFKIKAFSQCVDCHQDVHGGQFAAAPFRNRCEQCHTETGFHPSTFTLARHQQGGFPLGGAHAAVACVECHKPAEKPAAAAYHFQRTDCAACHSDPHRNQFAERMSHPDAAGRAAGCEACHTTHAWNQLPRFDHASTGFELTGAHRAAECVACHRPPNLERTLRNVDFKVAPQQCESCHQDPHGAQFARLGVTHCADCHTNSKWKPALFDHEKTHFSLTGGHQQVRCAACHASVRVVNDKPVVFYRPTPTGCAACHANNMARGS